MTRKNALLTLGRLPKALDIARALTSAGWRVVVAEPCRWHLCAVSRDVAASYRVPSPVDDRQGYRRALLDIIHREAVSLVVPVSEECLYIAELQDALPDDVTMFAAPFATVETLHDKLNFVERATSFDLAVPQTVTLDAPGARELIDTGGVVIKGRNSCAGVGLEFLDRGAPMPYRLYPGRWVAQRHVDGRLVSTYSIAHDGQALATVVYRGTIMSDTVAVCFERLTNELATEQWVTDFVAATGYSGMIAFDFVIDNDGKPWAIECNPRATSGVHFLSTTALAALLLEPTAVPADPCRPETTLMQFFPTLTEVQSRMFRPGFGAALAEFRRARDVSFQWRDPLPLWTLPVTAWRIMRLAMFSPMSFGEAATFDIEWRPES